MRENLSAASGQINRLTQDLERTVSRLKAESGPDAEALNNRMVEIENRIAACSDMLEESFLEDIRLLLQTLTDFRERGKAAHERADRHKKDLADAQALFLTSNKLPVVEPHTTGKAFAIGSAIENAGRRFIIGQMQYVELPGPNRFLAIYDLEGKPQLGFRLFVAPNFPQKGGNGAPKS